MRIDPYTGDQVPATLGEYRDLCVAIAPTSAAVTFLDGRIAADPDGREAQVLAPDSQMRALLFPMLGRPES
jgi:hypothetical protein